MYAYLSGFFLVTVLILPLLCAMAFRTVVTTNMVHIVQSRKNTVSYGKDQSANVYYRWPSWLPVIGITVTELPVSNFDLSLRAYEAYDKDRVPFIVDVVAFFRVAHTEMAAQRVQSIESLMEQLTQIVQGAVRKVLASSVIDTIMLERAQFGKLFTGEVDEQLAQWGVEPVKAMELMDIRDTANSKVIANIMAKKTSHIEMESRTEVAANHRAAETAEIQARQLVQVRQQEAEQAVGTRTAEKEQAVGVAGELSKQNVLDQARETRERDMAVHRVALVREAEITRDQKVVEADQDRQTRILVADGQLEATRRESIGIEVQGAAKAGAERLMQLAPVQAQIELAKEIGANDGYQRYLAIVKAVEAYVVVGSEQAQALKLADIKVIANTGKPIDGVNDAMSLLSSQGGTQLASMVEAFAQTPLGSSLMQRLTGAPAT